MCCRKALECWRMLLSKRDLDINGRSTVGIHGPGFREKKNPSDAEADNL